MGLHVYLYAQCDHIDPERWEALYLTTLQLLERFPGPLVKITAEPVRGGHRFTLTTQIQSNLGTPTEHWAVHGDLSSRRTAETYALYRHLAHYRSTFPQRRCAPGDILWLPDEESDNGDVAGYCLFRGKSQGYPYHYAMLAVGLLLENTLPGQVVVMGDINRSQAEQAAAWAGTVLHRHLELPIVTDAPRLWQRLVAAYPDQPAHAARRFFALYAGDRHTAWPVLLGLPGGPDRETLRSVFAAQLEPLASLQARGAIELIVALCEADGDIARTLDWVCGSGPDGQPAGFAPEDLLEALCDCGLTIPRHERAGLEALQAPPQALANIDDMWAQVFALMAGAPIMVDLSMDEEAVLAAFARRWPERQEKFRAVIRSCTERQRQSLRAWRAKLDERLTAGSSPEEVVPEPTAWSPLAEDHPVEPAAEFLRAEIERQRRDTSAREEVARLLGQQLAQALEKNQTLRTQLQAEGRGGLLEQIYASSSQHGFALSEAAWQAIERQATMGELRCLALLALIPEHEINFWHWRNHVLESPDLWPILCEAHAGT
ncbi:MAG: hypothetical protein L0Z62_26120 [Gemmataceae bacterium]|nr:hypothetical protein [Gemmataceae bacterium]